MVEEQLKKEIIGLRKAIFNMLNYANMYVLILDEQMSIKFANQSLATDLGFKKYREMRDLCWLDFVPEVDQRMIATIHKAIAEGSNWSKFKEFQNNIKALNGTIINVLWFNSHINTDFNWSFSFGIKQEPITEVSPDSIRNYYQDIINKDRTMIESMKAMILEKNTHRNVCEPSL